MAGSISKTTATFERPFSLSGFAEMLPAGEYDLQADVSAPPDHRDPDRWKASVLVQVRLLPRKSHPGLARSLTVPLSALEIALDSDRLRGSDLVNFFMEEMLADPMVQLVMLADRVSEAEIRTLYARNGSAATPGAGSHPSKPNGEPMRAVEERVAVLALPSLAQDGIGPAPENAEDRRYGNGWDCVPGYRIADGACVALDIPANAYPTGRVHGTGWDCDCGYRKQGDLCALIEVPENAHLSEHGIGGGWECNRGYAVQAAACAPVDIPENAYPTNASYGAAWLCERGFVEAGGRCDPVAVPQNAFLDERSHGPGWRCMRGFEARGESCVMIDLPENAHLDRSGNRWQCNRGVQVSEGERCRQTR